jgi:fructan beta-fructosidase
MRNKISLICILMILMSIISTNLLAQNNNASLQNQEMQTFNSYMDVGYDQVLRPQFHFTSRKNWLNDPNGMVYYDGEWHLYFQHNALSVKRGIKSWGHAVSTDMVHWTQLPHAILPYDNGAIWSGTAIVDHNNSLKKQVGDTKTLVAYFTKTNSEGFYQAMAFSTDRGRTFVLHNEGKAVIPNQGFMKGERDPKVLWDEKNKKWKIILILGGKERTIRIFESDNMIDWKKAGDINRKWAAECIDLFQLPVDGNKNNMKWVICDASFDYEIGQFVGNNFITEGPTLKGDYGKGFYAAQVFNNGPDGRVVQIGWMNDRREDCPFIEQNMPFNQQMGFPTDMSLRTTSDGIRLFRWPVAEIKSLYKESHAFKNASAEEITKGLANVKPELVDLSVEFEPGADGELELTIRGIKISYGQLIKYQNADKEVSEIKSFTFNGKTCPAPVIDGKVKLRILGDRTSMELYANDGANVASGYEFEIPDNLEIKVESKGNVKINSLIVNELMSSWK